MRFGSDSGWRPVERIDALVVGSGGIRLVRAVAWAAPCQPIVSSLSIRRIPGWRRDLVGGEALGRSLGPDPDAFDVDDGLGWYRHDGRHGLRCPTLAVTISVRASRRAATRPVAEVTRSPRRVAIRRTADHATDDAPMLQPGTWPGVHTRWPLLADTNPENVLGISPARIATGPAALFRNSEDHRLVG